MTVSVSSFTKEKAEIKSTNFDRYIGGRVFDDILVSHFVDKIKVQNY